MTKAKTAEHKEPTAKAEQVKARVMRKIFITEQTFVEPTGTDEDIQMFDKDIARPLIESGALKMVMD